MVIWKATNACQLLVVCGLLFYFEEVSKSNTVLLNKLPESNFPAMQAIVAVGSPQQTTDNKPRTGHDLKNTNSKFQTINNKTTAA
jgi:hypothetical protein